MGNMLYQNGEYIIDVDAIRFACVEGNCLSLMFHGDTDMVRKLFFKTPTDAKHHLENIWNAMS